MYCRWEGLGRRARGAVSVSGRPAERQRRNRAKRDVRNRRGGTLSSTQPARRLPSAAAISRPHVSVVLPSRPERDADLDNYVNESTDAERAAHPIVAGGEFAPRPRSEADVER